MVGSFVEIWLTAPLAFSASNHSNMRRAASVTECERLLESGMILRDEGTRRASSLSSKVHVPSVHMQPVRSDTDQREAQLPARDRAITRPAEELFFLPHF